MGITQQTLQAFLQTYFIDTVGRPEGFYDDTIPATPISYLEFPNRESDGPDSKREWIRLTTIMLPGSNRTAGLNRYTSGYPDSNSVDKSNAQGLLIVQIFEPANTGTGRHLVLADLIRENFEAFTTCGNAIKFGQVDGPIEVGRDGDFYQQNVEVSFRFMRE